MEVFATSVEGLFVVQQDYETTYTKQGGGEFIVNGEYDSGEAWVDGKHCYYEREDGEVKIVDYDGNLCYTFEDTEEGWDAFANSVT